MQLWRLSSERRARQFDGGFGLGHSGRWNTAGRAVTYCSSVPSLAALEKRVHVQDPALLPPQVMIEYHAPDDLLVRRVEIGQLPPDWARLEIQTQSLGDDWLDRAVEDLLIVPSAIVALERAPDRNVLVNHRRRAGARIVVTAVTPFTLDPRLFRA